MYKLTNYNQVIRISDSFIIPVNFGEPLYVEYLAWLAEGNTPLPADPPTPAELFAAIELAIQSHINSVAQQDGWDSQNTCMARAGYANPWQTKAIRYSQWVDSCWIHTLTERDKIIAGTRPNIPTPAEAVAELPLFYWSSV